MSFIKDAKAEVLSKFKILKPNALSFLFGLFKTCGEYNLNSKQIKILTNFEQIYSAVEQCLRSLELESEISLEIFDEKTFNSNFKYEISIPKSATIFLIEQFTQENFVETNIKTKNQKLAFIKAIFIATATGTISLNSSSKSYLLEFIFQDYNYAEFFCELLANFDILTKKIVRKTQYVVYLNKLDFISDFFALMSATNSVLQLQNESALRNLRNNINRQNNCMEANINKTINASVKQINAINTIQSTIGLESLDYTLQEICLLRLANPEESLEQLLKLLNNKISKSGLNHRLNKIIKIAQMLEN